MVYFYLVPSSFLKFSVIMQILFAIVSILVSYFSFSIYKISKQREIKLFGISFLLISFSYIILAIVHSAIAFPTIVVIAKLATNNISRLGGIGLLLYIILFTMGLITLSYTKLKIKSGKAYYLLLGLALITIITPLVITSTLYPLIASGSVYTLFITSKILSVFLLTFIIYNYLEEYSKNNNKKTLLISIAFTLLFLSNVDFILSIKYYQAYIIGNILELIAYIFILISLILSIKK